jgi:hypothetical protein
LARAVPCDLYSGGKFDEVLAAVLANEPPEFPNDGSGPGGATVTETQFYLPDTFPTQESAIEAAIQAGRQKIDAAFERGSVVLHG